VGRGLRFQNINSSSTQKVADSRVGASLFQAYQAIPLPVTCPSFYVVIGNVDAAEREYLAIDDFLFHDDPP
jgi:hypothetical protein